MNNNPLLRAVDNLLSDTTLIVFIIGIVFLAIQHWISNKAMKWTPNNWVTAYLGALCSYLILVAGYFTIKITLSFVQEIRFSPTSFEIAASDSEMANRFHRSLLNALYVPFLYMLYYTFNELSLKKIKTDSIRMIAEAVSMLFIIYLAMISGQLISYGSFPRFWHSIAVWVPGPFGMSLACFVYSYHTYLNGFKVQENALQIAVLKQQVTQSQLDVLSSKINPHFLYNSLNSIAAFATVDSAKTRGMAIALSKLFKYSLNNEEKNYAHISDEIGMVALYLDIEKIRFEDKLRYNCYVQEGISDCLIPRNLLQPLVENAIKHGSGTDGIDINISIEKSNKGGIIIQVKDSGTAFTSLNLGYGLKSIYDKLDILVPGNYEIAFFNEPKMVQIELFDAKFRVYEK